MATQTDWYYCNAEGETIGPVDVYQLAGLLDASAITPSTMIWAEGKEQWQPLQDDAEIYSQVYSISSAHASAVPTATPLSGKGGPTEMAQPAVLASEAEPMDELAKFSAEMVALGESAGDADEALRGQNGARSPSPEEKEFTDDDGTNYVWDARLRKFQPKGVTAVANSTAYGVDEMTFQADEEQQPAYEPPENQDVLETNSDADEVIPAEAEIKPKPAEAASKSQPKDRGKKRKAEDVIQREAEKMKRAKEQEEASKRWFDLKVNTSIYVTGLPDDITEQQLAERFTQYGVLKTGEQGAPKVKVYRDRATQMPKGDGLVTYLYEPSVDLACKLADDDHFRPGMSRKMKVQAAKFEMHGEQYVPKKKSRNKNSKEKAKVADKVLGWGGFDDTVKASQVTVILENLFAPEEISEDITLLKDLEADISTECGKMGAVDKVRIFAGNPKGIASVKFKTVEAAEKCMSTMKGRYFGGRAIEAHMWDGSTNYNVKLQETDDQIATRKARFEQELESQNKPSDPPEPE